MKELDPLVFLAVFQEMLGPLLWVLLLLIIAGTAAFVVLLLKERTIVSRRLVRSELAGLAGGVLALILMAKVSSSGFTDAGGPADWFLIALVFGLGLAGTTILVYSAAGWRAQRQEAK
ncbi:DUF5368 domain-containing protein [Azovibrio restrictus]|uniref:DUF5368 domain-containing protein n=1 Tax=Azovibrio restrictus TaxID=146938 RepID=UPI0004058EAD|nr:DUF5368 domain-containing protein [Azovibrio restrictus]MCE1169915.1 DUF5368 domain-containing protein [Azovibrio sp.]